MASNVVTGTRGHTCPPSRCSNAGLCRRQAGACPGGSAAGLGGHSGPPGPLPSLTVALESAPKSSRYGYTGSPGHLEGRPCSPLEELHAGWRPRPLARQRPPFVFQERLCNRCVSALRLVSPGRLHRTSLLLPGPVRPAWGPSLARLPLPALLPLSPGLPLWLACLHAAPPPKPKHHLMPSPAFLQFHRCQPCLSPG